MKKIVQVISLLGILFNNYSSFAQETVILRLNKKGWITEIKKGIKVLESCTDYYVSNYLGGDSVLRECSVDTYTKKGILSKRETPLYTNLYFYDKKNRIEKLNVEHIDNTQNVYHYRYNEDTVAIFKYDNSGKLESFEKYIYENSMLLKYERYAGDSSLEFYSSISHKSNDILDCSENYCLRYEFNNNEQLIGIFENHGKEESNYEKITEMVYNEEGLLSARIDFSNNQIVDFVNYIYGVHGLNSSLVFGSDKRIKQVTKYHYQIW